MAAWAMNSPPDVVLVDQTSPLAYAPQGAANVRGLIKMLFPVDEATTGPDGPPDPRVEPALERPPRPPRAGPEGDQGKLTMRSCLQTIDHPSFPGDIR